MATESISNPSRLKVNEMTFLKLHEKGTAAWELANTAIGSSLSPSQEYWYQTAGKALATLLDSAGYDKQDQVSILFHFVSLSAPYLGPLPGSKTAQWKSFMTDDHTPIELSWDFKTGTERPMIRYSIEPIAQDAGSLSNPHNSGTAKEFAKTLLGTFSYADTTWLNHFESRFCQAWTPELPEGHSTTMFWAFDLRGTAGTNKAYFFPGCVARANKKSTLATVTEAIITAPGYNSEELKALEKFVSHVQQNSKENALEIDMLAFDLVHVDEFRLKVYFRDRRTNFASVIDNMSLGGLIGGEDFDIGMRRLKKLWDSLMGTKNSSASDPLPEKTHRTAGILYNVELKAGCPRPKVKIYIPVRHYAKNDERIAKALTQFLMFENNTKQDMGTVAWNTSRYYTCLHNIFLSDRVSSGLGIHTYIGCSVEKFGKLRVVSYLNPQAEKLREG